jgi:uncharacterized membrane protein
LQQALAHGMTAFGQYDIVVQFHADPALLIYQHLALLCFLSPPLPLLSILLSSALYQSASCSCLLRVSTFTPLSRLPSALVISIADYILQLLQRNTTDANNVYHYHKSKHQTMLSEIIHLSVQLCTNGIDFYRIIP